jgi:hypothetical protein
MQFYKSPATFTLNLYDFNYLIIRIPIRICTKTCDVNLKPWTALLVLWFELEKRSDTRILKKCQIMNKGSFTYYVTLHSGFLGSPYPPVTQNHTNPHLFKYFRNTSSDPLKQAWAILRCVVSMIYLNMITLAVCNEILHTRLLYILKINFGTKKFFWPSCDLLLNFIVLVKDLGLPLKEKKFKYVVSY